MINNNYNNYNNRSKKEYNLHHIERLLLMTLRQTNKTYNVIGNTDIKYLDFIREVTMYYSDIVDFLKKSDKNQERIDQQGTF